MSSTPEQTPCPECGALTDSATIAEGRWYPFWRDSRGACPACVQERLLQRLLEKGDAALHHGVQATWPLDAESAFGVLPTPLRLHADPRYIGAGVTIAMVDSDFFPHADLVRPVNRIRAWVDATVEPAVALHFREDEEPRWPSWDAGADAQWHGTMTTVAAAGNGFVSHGLYRGLAPESRLVLVRVRDSDGDITSDSIARALRWIARHGPTLGVRVVNLSVSGDELWPPAPNPVDRAVASLVDAGVCVVAAAGNDGVRRLIPPATAPWAITVGGIDDSNILDHRRIEMWHGNYGISHDGGPKPELVAPSVWVVAPVLPMTAAAAEASALFDARTQALAAGDGRLAEIDARIGERKLVTPHYQHVEGTSFAAPLVTSTIACMLEAKPSLVPRDVRAHLHRAAWPVEGVPVERQGAGALDAGRSVASALGNGCARIPPAPDDDASGVRFTLHDRDAGSVEVLGSWDGWARPVVARAVTHGLWETERVPVQRGTYAYKFRINGDRWLDDPSNPWKRPDGVGGFNSVFDRG